MRFLSALIAAVFMLGSSHAATAPIPSDVLFSDPRVSDVKISPDGTRLAVLILGEENSIRIISVTTLEVMQDIGLKSFPAHGLNWVNNDRVMITLDILEEDRGVTYLMGQRTITVDTNNQNVALMFGQNGLALRDNRYLGNIVNFLPEDDEHILMTARNAEGNHIWKVNVLNGKTTKHQHGGTRTLYWFTNREGKAVIRVDWGSSRWTRYIFGRTDDSEDWELIRRIHLRQDNEQPEFWPVADAEDADQYYVLTNPDNEEFSSIKLYDIKADAYVETVFAAEDADVISAVVTDGTDQLSGAIIGRDRIETVLFDPAEQAHIEGIDAYFDNDANLRFTDFSTDGRYALIFVSSPTRPGEYHLYDYQQSKLTFLFKRRDDLSPADLGQMEIATYPARDGTALTAYVTHPAGLGPDDPAPLVVLVHGGPELRDSYDFDATVQYLASRGYRIIQPYFRGSSGKGRSFTEAGYRQWGGLMQDDVTDAARHWQETLGLASPQTTCIVGTSYGGYAAMIGGATSADRYACVAARAGVSDLMAQLSYSRKEQGASSAAYQYWLKAIGDPKNDRDRLKAASPITYAREYALPVMLSHGDDDDIVAVKQSREMERALRKSGHKVEYHEYDDEGHSFRQWETEIAYHDSLADFLDRHIGQQ